MTVTDTPDTTTKSVLHVLDKTGDTRIEWSVSNDAEVKAARAHFDLMVKEKKYLAYKVDKHGNKGEVIRTFDPYAGKIILTPQTVGG